MDRKTRMDLPGTLGMVTFATVLAGNQVVIKLTNTGIAPVFGAGLRSILALAVLGLWCLVMRKRITGLRESWVSGVLLGAVFAIEFVFLFLALDLTTVSRASIVFYSMPVWLALVGHFVLPGERLSALRLIGLVLAMAGVALALSDPASRSEGSVLGDALALCAALFWAGIALIVRLGTVARQPAETQLFWQLTLSSVILLALAPLFGDVLRDPSVWHWVGIGAQAVIVASLGFLFWLKLMATYPASDIAAFSFLSPVLAVGFGWAVLGEPFGQRFVLALILVAVGIVLVNRRKA